MREGQAKLLSERDLPRVVNAVKKKAHAKRNIALLYCSFGLGLRDKEMSALTIKHVLGVDSDVLDEINLTGAMTKGSKQRHAYLTNPKVVGAIRDFITDRQKHEGILFSFRSTAVQVAERHFIFAEQFAAALSTHVPGREIARRVQPQRSAHVRMASPPR